MTVTEAFGSWLKRRRKALDLTQDALARLVGCSVVSIRKFESDAQRPSRQLAELLAVRLQIPPNERATFVQFARQGLDATPPDLPLPEEARVPERLPHTRPDMRPAPRRGAPRMAPEAPARPLPTGTVTFLFTDLEGSTQLWEQHAQAMAAALAQHDLLLKQAIADHGGVVVKTTGDGVHAAFARASDAVMAALAAQRALYPTAWGSLPPLRVRMALHSGVSEERDGDYYGPPLNRVARLLAAAHGGQVLLSRSTADLARETLPPDVMLRDLGERQLRDLRPEPVFQLVAPDLPADFPPLKTLDRPRHNLPPQPTALIGREWELKNICVLIGRPNVRLVTLTGPGGTGKTRLALQVATELLDQFRDGTFFVALAPIRDPALVGPALAQTLSIKEASDRSIVERIKEYLSDRQMLLVLDNFEQVIDAALLVRELLDSAPELKILVTSRSALRLAGEHEFAVPPLTLPDRANLPAIERLMHYESIRLFVERTQAIQPSFALDAGNAAAVAEICHRLDGLPLAIELAAARSRLFSPMALLARLGGRLKLLTGGARDLPERQQTIRNTIDWSYQLLGEGEKKHFTRLGVFVGGWTLEAAEAVCNAGGDLPTDIVDGIAALLDQSLVRQTEPIEGEPRFVMLETIREYALERLEQRGEADATRQQHAAYFVGLAERAEPLLQGAEQLAWLNQLKADYENLRAVLAWSHTTANTAGVGLRLAGALWMFWQVGGYLSEGREQLTRILAHPEAAAPTVARARALFTAGWLIGAQGDFALANTRLTESHTLSQAIAYQQGIAYACLGLGFVAQQQGEYATQRALHAESLTLFRELGEPWPIAASLYYLGGAELYLDNYERAVPLLEESMRLFRDLDDQIMYGYTLLDLGYAARLQGDNARAAACYAETLTLFQNLRHTWGIAAVQQARGWLAQAQGDIPRAAACFAESLVRYRDLGHREGISICLAGSAGTAGSLGQPVRAARLFGAAEGLRARIGANEQPVERAVYADSVAGVRAQLDQETFVAAWAEGRALTLEQAIALALEVAAEVPPPAPAPPSVPQQARAAAEFPAELTAREIAVLRLVAQGLTDAQVAEQLVISRRTVNAHLRSIYSKLGVTTRTAAAHFAITHQLT